MSLLANDLIATNYSCIIHVCECPVILKLCLGVSYFSQKDAQKNGNLQISKLCLHIRLRPILLVNLSIQIIYLQARKLKIISYDHSEQATLQPASQLSVNLQLQQPLSQKLLHKLHVCVHNRYNVYVCMYVCA